MWRDFEGNTVVATNLQPLTATTNDDANGATVDLLGYEGVTFIGAVGDDGDTLSSSVAIHFQVEHSDDASSWSDCADTDITNSVTGATTGTFANVEASANCPSIYETTYIGNKRYVRAVLLMEGTHSNGTGVCCISVKWGAKVQPAV